MSRIEPTVIKFWGRNFIYINSCTLFLPYISNRCSSRCTFISGCTILTSKIVPLSISRNLINVLIHICNYILLPVFKSSLRDRTFFATSNLWHLIENQRILRSVILKLRSVHFICSHYLLKLSLSIKTSPTVCLNYNRSPICLLRM